MPSFIIFQPVFFLYFQVYFFSFPVTLSRKYEAKCLCAISSSVEHTSAPSAPMAQKCVSDSKQSQETQDRRAAISERFSVEHASFV